MNVLNMALMGPKHGFGSALSGCLIFIRDTVCSLIGFMAVDEPLGGMVKKLRGEPRV